MVTFLSLAAVRIYDHQNDKEMSLKWQSDSIMHLLYNHYNQDALWIAPALSAFEQKGF